MSPVENMCVLANCLWLVRNCKPNQSGLQWNTLSLKWKWMKEKLVSWWLQVFTHCKMVVWTWYMCETETLHIWRLQACITIVSVAQKVSLHRSTVGPGQLAGGWVSEWEWEMTKTKSECSFIHPPTLVKGVQGWLCSGSLQWLSRHPSYIRCRWPAVQWVVSTTHTTQVNYGHKL